jgi:glutathione S-transferase
LAANDADNAAGQILEEPIMITLCGFAVSNYYNKLKLILLEKQIPFQERLVYPWERNGFVEASPLGKIPFVETDHGPLSESQIILEYIEDQYHEIPLYPADAYERARCRELIQHLELNAEWVVRRLYKEAFFGGAVSEETKQEAHQRLIGGLGAIARIVKFSPFVFGADFTAADCVAFVHFTMISAATTKIFGVDMLSQLVPTAVPYMEMMAERPHFQRMMQERADATAAFAELNVAYDG